MWHKGLAKAKEQGHDMHFLFRLYYPKPGDHEEYRLFRNHITEHGMPTKEEIDNESYEMLMPSHWRKKAFENYRNMEEFWKAKYTRDIKPLKESQRCGSDACGYEGEWFNHAQL